MSRFSELNDPRLLFMVEHALTVAECAAEISRMETAAPVLTTDGTPRETVRHNSRVVLVDEGLAAKAFQRVSAVVPATLAGMNPTGANECLRYYRYTVGDCFKPHQDTDFQRSARERSLLTAVFYLNDDYQGGELFFPKLGRVIKPSAGTAVLFGHRMLHESTLLTSGVKYAFRTDIMYATP